MGHYVFIGGGVDEAVLSNAHNLCFCAKVGK